MTDVAAKPAKKPMKPSFFERLKKRGLELVALGTTLINDPKSFPGDLLRFLRKTFRTVWDARGGGLYALGFLVTFIWLELKMFVNDIIEFESLASFFGEQIFEMLFRYIGESFSNTISAFLWPVYFLQVSPPWGLLGLGVAFVVFAKFLKKPVERWIFDDPKDGGEKTNI